MEASAQEPFQPRQEGLHLERQTTQEKSQLLFRASPAIIAVAISAGSTTSSYLTSVGYFEHKLSTDLLVGLQALVVAVAHFGVLVAGQFFDASFDRRFGVVHTYGFRIIGTAIVSSLMSLAVPVCNSIGAVLAIGAIISISSNAQISSTTQLASTGFKGGGMLILLGVAIGALFPLVTSRLTGFTPGCTFAQAMHFYIVSCIIGLLGVVVWTVEHCLALKVVRRSSSGPIDAEGADSGVSSSCEEPGDLFKAEAPDERQSLTSTGRFIRTAYQSVRRTSSMKTYSGRTCTTSERIYQVFAYLRSMCTFSALSIFVNFVVGFMLITLFAKASPTTVQALYLSKCIGDVVARVSALLHSHWCKARGYVHGLERCVCFIALAIRTVLAVLLMIALSCGRVQGGTLTPLVYAVFVFALGGYAFLMLDLDEQFKGPADDTWRKQVQGWHLVVMAGGQSIGVGIGLAWIRSIPGG